MALLVVSCVYISNKYLNVAVFPVVYINNHLIDFCDMLTIVQVFEWLCGGTSAM